MLSFKDVDRWSDPPLSLAPSHLPLYSLSTVRVSFLLRTNLYIYVQDSQVDETDLPYSDGCFFHIKCWGNNAEAL